jgi:hypothetical protein
VTLFTADTGITEKAVVQNRESLVHNIKQKILIFMVVSVVVVVVVVVIIVAGRVVKILWR